MERAKLARHFKVLRKRTKPPVVQSSKTKLSNTKSSSRIYKVRQGKSPSLPESEGISLNLKRLPIKPLVKICIQPTLI